MIDKFNIETYALFNNVNDSILNLNIFLKKYGYEFIIISIPELEENFYELFASKNNTDSKDEIKFKNDDIKISLNFFESLNNSVLPTTQIFQDKKAYLLKKTSENSGNNISLNSILEISANLQTFVSNLLIQLRLFKNGDIFCSSEFLIEKDSRAIITKSNNNSYRNHTTEKFELSKLESFEFSKMFNDKFTGNTLTELAISNFNLSYEISDLNTRYITLMTCLESIFNQNRDSISHIIARHLSLIISRTNEEFNENYSRIKQLYNYRSSITHGSKLKESISQISFELEEYARISIRYCLNITESKKDLYNRLNSSGILKVSDGEAAANNAHKKLLNSVK